jgi:hypothetical protein
MVIMELGTVLVIIIFIGVVVWRDKNRFIIELTLINEGLLAQIDALEAQIKEHRQAEAEISGGFDEIAKGIDQGISHAVDKSQENWMQMERLLTDQDALVEGLQEKLNSSSELDKPYIEAELNALKKSLDESKHKVVTQKNELKTTKRNLKDLKEKVRNLSKKVLSMSGLEIREKRLLREKIKLKEKFDEIKSKYEGKILSNKKMELELRTSFRAEEVQAIKDELKTSEEALLRAMSENKFLEEEYLSLDENSLTQQELKMELERATREITLLESTVIDMDEESKNA